jgi:hypothetical protein
MATTPPAETVNAGPNQATDETRPQPPRGELFADPGAKVVWAAILALDVGMQHAVYQQLASELAVSEDQASKHGRRLARAVGALREAAELLTAQNADLASSQDAPALGVEAYRRLRRRHPEAGWPPDSSIRRWLGGSWNDALRRAQLEPLPEGDALVREIGSRLTRAECLAALQSYYNDTGERRPNLWRYVAWTKRPDILARPGRRPQSGGPFTRIFGSWTNALVSAGLLVLASGVDSVSEDAGGADQEAGDARTLLPRSGYGYSEGQLKAALCEIASRLGRSPKRHEYNSERNRILVEEEVAGLPVRAIPSWTLLQGRYLTWDAALVAAGLEPTNGRHIKAQPATRKSRPRFSDQQILVALQEAHKETCAEGERLTGGRYRLWRRAHLDRDLAAGRYRPLPDLSCIQQRFGGWPQAIQRALDEHGSNQQDVSG